MAPTCLLRRCPCLLGHQNLSKQHAKCGLQMATEFSSRCPWRQSECPSSGFLYPWNATHIVQACGLSPWLALMAGTECQWDARPRAKLSCALAHVILTFECRYCYCTHFTDDSPETQGHKTLSPSQVARKCWHWDRTPAIWPAPMPVPGVLNCSSGFL